MVVPVTVTVYVPGGEAAQEPLIVRVEEVDPPDDSETVVEGLKDIDNV